MLAYDQPINQAKSDATPPASAAGFRVQELIGSLWQRRIAIAMAGLICACAAVAIGKSLTPKYSASAELYVDPRELQLVDRELTPRAQDISGLAMVVESQARLITSNGVLLQVIKDTGIDKDPEFGGDSVGLTASLLGLFGIEPKSGAAAKSGPMTALDILNRHVTVKKTDRTFIVDIDVWSHDPAKAAMLANAIAKAYLEESKKSQAAAARRATTDLSGRLKELKERLRTAENALAIYKAQNNFVGTQDTLISDQQLSASNQRLAAARALTLDAQAKYDQIEASRRASTDAGAIPEALQSPTIANLRAQYAEARKRYAELTSELGPLHPSLRQMGKQVDDLRRTINEEVDRFAQSAKNDLIRARDYEASLNKSLEAQKRQSIQLSEASVRLRELERDVEASRDVYQSFLKRSRETEEQESLNTSSARIIGEATVPQRRIFPPGMSLLAMVGFVFGAVAAGLWAAAADRLSFPGRAPQPVGPETRISGLAKQPSPDEPRPAAPIALIEKPLIAQLQESDVMRTLGGILAGTETPDLTRLGWPTLRPGAVRTAFLDAMREARTVLGRRAPGKTTPVMAVISSAGVGNERTVAALNVALAAARDGVRVLVIDTSHPEHALSDRAGGHQRSTSRKAWFGLSVKELPAIETANGISVLPAFEAAGDKAAEAARAAVVRARASGAYGLIIIEGPAMPWTDAGHSLLDLADGLMAVLPANLDINNCIEEIIAALGGTERKLIGVILNELKAENYFREREYA